MKTAIALCEKSNRILLCSRLHHAPMAASCNSFHELTDMPSARFDWLLSGTDGFSSIPHSLLHTQKNKTIQRRGLWAYVWGGFREILHTVLFIHTLTISFPLESQSWGFGPELSHVSKKSCVFIMLDLIKTNSVTDALSVACLPNRAREADEKESITEERNMLIDITFIFLNCF